MNPPDEGTVLVKDLRTKLEQLETLIGQKEEEYQEQLRKKEEAKRECEMVINERDELDKILDECSVDVCKYKTEFKHIRDKYGTKIGNYISNQKFHFFLCYREQYGSEGGEPVIESHRKIIEEHGFCWWGKFSKGRVKGGNYVPLEPFGESISVDGNATVAQNIRSKVLERVGKQDCVYLYLCDPNPPKIRLHVCNVSDFWFGQEQVPYQNDPEHMPPACAHIPGYLFHKREGNCLTCKGLASEKCKLRFLSNFWFKIDNMLPLDDVAIEYENLVNCFTKDSINFAIPILYPLLVFRKEEKSYFPETVKAPTSRPSYTLHVAAKEHGHTRVDVVKSFFDDLNEACNQCFVRVESSTCVRQHSGKPELQKSGKDNEIIIHLPESFRRDGKAMRFKISLDKNTKAEQRNKVEEMIQAHLD